MAGCLWCASSKSCTEPTTDGKQCWGVCFEGFTTDCGPSTFLFTTRSTLPVASRDVSCVQAVRSFRATARRARRGRRATLGAAGATMAPAPTVPACSARSSRVVAFAGPTLRRSAPATLPPLPLAFLQHPGYPSLLAVLAAHRAWAGGTSQWTRATSPRGGPIGSKALPSLACSS